LPKEKIVYIMGDCSWSVPKSLLRVTGRFVAGMCTPNEMNGEIMKSQMAKLLANYSTLPFFATPQPVSIKEAIKIKCTMLFKPRSSTNTGSWYFMASVVKIA
jgi:predicted secreted Zn-dependent protease